MKRKDRFDYIMIETTGLADPAPVAQTFFVDDEMKRKMALDGIVTVVDAKHIWQHIDDSDEAKEQIAFADVILLNKIDLVPTAEVDKLEARIREMNVAAKIYRTQNAEIDMARILNVGGFNLGRALEVDPMFLEPEYPFEWAGVFRFEVGTYRLVLQGGADPTMNLVLVPVADASFKALEAVQFDTVLTFSADEQKIHPSGEIKPGQVLHQLILPEEESCFTLQIPVAGTYALFTEHRPAEFSAVIAPNQQPDKRIEALLQKEYKPDHEHDEEVSSVGIMTPGDLDEKKLNKWLRDVLMNKGADIFRMKGILSLKNHPRRFVFQGVHMLFDGRPDREWGSEPRHNSLVFIGRNLNRAALTEGFEKCLA